MEQQKQTDHDLLIELKSEVRALRDELKKVTDSYSKLVEDHETRIRSLEKQVDDYAIIKKLVYGAVGVVLLSFMGALTYLVINK